MSDAGNYDPEGRNISTSAIRDQCGYNSLKLVIIDRNCKRPRRLQFDLCFAIFVKNRYREVDFPRVRDFATAATREQSLKDLGYDLTDPEQGDEEEKYYGVATVFYVSKDQIYGNIDNDFEGRRREVTIWL